MPRAGRKHIYCGFRVLIKCSLFNCTSDPSCPLSFSVQPRLQLPWLSASQPVTSYQAHDVTWGNRRWQGRNSLMGCEAGNRGEVSYFGMGCQQLTADTKLTWQTKGPSCCFQPWQRNLLTFNDGLALTHHQVTEIQQWMGWSPSLRTDALVLKAQCAAGTLKTLAPVMASKRPRSKLLQARVTLDLGAGRMSKALISAPF